MEKEEYGKTVFNGVAFPWSEESIWVYTDKAQYFEVVDPVDMKKYKIDWQLFRFDYDGASAKLQSDKRESLYGEV